MNYPKWIYFKDGLAMIVKSKNEHDLYPESKESPAEFSLVELKPEAQKSKKVKKNG